LWLLTVIQEALDDWNCFCKRSFIQKIWEIARSWTYINLSQIKYVLDLLEETCLLGARSIDIPMDTNNKLLEDKGELFEDRGRYRRLVGKLNYLTVTKLDI
jgi:hypothetical protein